jgi:hypothetical protein
MNKSAHTLKIIFVLQYVMFIDIVFPDKNEEEFLKMAARLNSKVLFVYKDQVKKLPGSYAGLLWPKQGQKSDILLGSPEDVDVKAVKLIYGLEGNERKDGTHQRNTGMNHVTCAAAKAKEKILCIDFSALLLAENKPLILGRMLQNARLMRKYKNDFLIASFAKTPWHMRQGRDYLAVLSTLGFDGKEGKKAINQLENTLLGNE